MTKNQPDIAIVNCGSSKVPDIARMLEEHGAKTKVIQPGEIAALDLSPLSAIVLSGNPALFRDTGTELVSDYERLRAAELPILGICFGHQVIGLLHGADVSIGAEDRDLRPLELLAPHPLFEGMPPQPAFKEDHTEEISLPAGFVHLARSALCENEAMAHATKPIYSVQCHPEVSGDNGSRFFGNFLALL